MSLFLRIFLSFWLAAFLLATSFFLFGRYYAGEAVERTEAVLKAQAEVVTALWQEGGPQATRNWLFNHGRRARIHLLDAQGRSPFSRREPRTPWHGGPLSPGVKRLGLGRIAVVVEVPGVTPPLYLVRHIDRGRLHRIPVAVWLLIAMVIVGLVSLALASALTKRIRRLRTAAQVIAEGDLSARVSVKGRDEVSALAHDFNLMAERIEEMLQSQRQLIRDVSHELRSPLARLRIALELAQRAEQPASALMRIEKEADELEHLVSDLLSLSRIESGQTQLERRTVPLCGLLQGVVADASFEGEAGGRRVSLARCDESRVEGDAVLLHAAIENVVRNALRYTPEGGEVTVQLQRDEQHLTITVEDQGPGVAEAELERLFEPFSRVGEARERESGGFGLGLAITGRTLLIHGGNAWAENRPEGGLRVTLQLPTAAS